MTRTTLIAFVFGLTLWGCGLQPHPPLAVIPPVVVMNEDLAAGVPYWVADGYTKYPEFVLLAVHGQTMYGQWYAFPDDREALLVDDVLWDLRRKHPGIRIVAVVCNPDGLVTEVPGVTYAQKTVWAIPTRHTGLFVRLTRSLIPDTIGSINQLIENP